METSRVIIHALVGWIAAIVYYQIEVTTGVDFKPLLFVAIIITAGTLLSVCRNNEQTEGKEA